MLYGASGGLFALGIVFITREETRWVGIFWLLAGLDGRISGMTQPVDQMLLTAALLYILVPSLMVVLSLILRPRANRVTNMAVSLLYAVTVAVSCIGETWMYYLLGSAVEVVLLLAIARTARKWPRQPLAS